MCVINIFSKYAWVAPLKDATNAFQKSLKESNKRQSQSEGSKPNKIWVHKGSEFYNNYFTKGFKENNIEMYLTHNEGKYVVTERFIRTLKTKICK